MYSFVGIVPVRLNVEGRPKSIPVVVLIGCVHFLNVIGVICSLIFHPTSPNRVTQVSNWIQMIMNCITLMMCHIIPIWKAKYFNQMLISLKNIDEALTEAGVDIDYTKHRKMGRRIFISCTFLLAYLTIYDFYVANILLKSMTWWYWLVSLMPTIVYSFTIIVGCQTMYLIKLRYQYIDEWLNKRLRGGCDSRLITEVIKIMSKNKNIKCISNDSSTIKDIFVILNDLNLAIADVESYYGPIFLAAFSTIFVITTIQFFNCYKVLVMWSPALNVSVDNLFIAANIVLLGISLVFSTCTICEQICNVTKNIVDRLNALKLCKQKEFYYYEVNIIDQNL